jgi:hypothetical protein
MTAGLATEVTFLRGMTLRRTHVLLDNASSTSASQESGAA